MNRLVNDKFVRTTAQTILVSVIVILVVTSVLFDGFVLARHLGSSITDGSFAVAFFASLKVPFQDNFAPFVVVFGGLVPVVFSSVCFRVDTSTGTPTVTADLNRVGHTVILLMVVGLVLGAIALLLFATNLAISIDYLVTGSNNREAVRGLIAAIVSFEAVYFAQLLGLQPK